jgi:hypothetical protein
MAPALSVGAYYYFTAELHIYSMVILNARLCIRPLTD